MSCFVTHLGGTENLLDDTQSLSALLDELADADREHNSVAITDESGWTLGIYPGGLVTWENVEDDVIGPVHLGGLNRQQILELMVPVAVSGRDWKPGYSS